jgi:hypothetical protein
LIPGKSILAIFEPTQVEVPDSVAVCALAPAAKHQTVASTVNARIMPLLSNYAPEHRVKSLPDLKHTNSQLSQMLRGRHL